MLVIVHFPSVRTVGRVKSATALPGKAGEAIKAHDKLGGAREASTSEMHCEVRTRIGMVPAR